MGLYYGGGSECKNILRSNRVEKNGRRAIIIVAADRFNNINDRRTCVQRAQ